MSEKISRDELKQLAENMKGTGISEGAIKGYCIEALEAAGIEPEKIEAAMSELKWLLDTQTPEAAEQHYNKSRY